MARQRTAATPAVQPVLRCQLVDLRAQFGGHAGDDQVLVRRQAELAAMHARDRTQAAEVQCAAAIGHAAGGNVQGEMPAAVFAFHPTIAVTAVVEQERAGRGQREAGAAFDFGLEPVETAVVDGVLQPPALAHFAVAEIALRGQHGFGHLQHLLRGDESDDVGETRIGVRIAVAGAHAAAHAEVVAHQAPAFDDGDEAEVVGEHVDVVERRHREGGLELARQVGGAVQRLLFLAAAGDLFLVQPDLVVRARVRQQVIRKARRVRVHARMQIGLQRIGSHQYVAIDVAAGGDGVDQRAVDRLQRRLQLALDDAVELERLARGDAQAVVGEARGDGIHLQPLLGADHAARRACADHEAVVGLEQTAAAFIAHVAVVLLVAAVKLQQYGVGFGDGAGDRIGQTLDQGAAQAAAVCLDGLDRELAHQYRSRA